MFARCFSAELLIIVFLTIGGNLLAQDAGGFQIARLKYNGGGDWYNDPSAEVNLLRYVGDNTNIQTKPEYVFVDVSTDDIFYYPFLFMTGHGNVVFSDDEARRLKTYLENGGFLYVDDDYGLDRSFRREMKKVFPDRDLVELPFGFGLYHVLYDFNYGPPKTHEHDIKPPQGFAIFINGRLAVYYTYESNPSDGWTDPEVHNDPPEKREEALKFGTNIIVWVLSN
ncbi:MAG: hypothetical protein A2V66_05295 [Ignavibacteria bacterium RBG_13_36_8]|nr:MAG: hypothetical protein A2V66_05295 [Ignavibacteria bacterium RBG_13_36_8]